MTEAKPHAKTASVKTAGGRPSTDGGLGRLVFHSLCSAACAIVPVPFLDDHLVKLTRRRMVRELASDSGWKLTANQLAVLSGTQSKPMGCGCFLGLLVSMGIKVVLKILRRIFRTILFWLLVKDAADAASRTLHEGYLVKAVLERNGRAGEPAATMEALRAPVDGVLKRVNTQALNHAFRGVLAGSRKAMVGLASTLSRLTGLKSEADDGEASLDRELEDAIPATLIDRVAQKLSLQSEYFRRLDEFLTEEIYLRQQPQQQGPHEDQEQGGQEQSQKDHSRHGASQQNNEGHENDSSK